MVGMLLLGTMLMLGQGDVITSTAGGSGTVTGAGSLANAVNLDIYADAGMRLNAAPAMPNCQGHRQEALVGVAPLTTYLAVVTLECTPERCGPTTTGQMTLTPITDTTMRLAPMTTFYGTGDGAWSVPPHD